MDTSVSKIDALDQWLNQKARIDEVDLTPFGFRGESLHLLREDQIMEVASGNKLRKLLPNLKQAAKIGVNRVLTFGGAYSNHIAATAAAGQKFGYQTIGLIRGEELTEKIHENPTLSKAKRCGMELVFVRRQEYKRRFEAEYLSALQHRYGPCVLIPEGGSNDLAIQGVANMVQLLPKKFRVLCTPIGTGGTMAGLLEGARTPQEVWGFSALKGVDFVKQLEVYGEGISRTIFTHFHFGGYAKANRELIDFINNFKACTQVPLDPIYTGKMMFGLLDVLRTSSGIDISEILVLHTGGLQGIEGFNASNKALSNIS
ncbi:MAG TPA: 1-aminocyclopropane-1-carboxylate deaminase [Flavobacteriaceae bacterium]|nr:1-aminocyclopropane-1-carboxylate deaminase [Flavobacteriaceae bacterium]